MQTTLPPTPTADRRPGPTVARRHRTRAVGAAAFGVVIAVLALIFASVAVVFGGDDGSPDPRHRVDPEGRRPSS